ncbi:MAG: carbohydrate-binding family 9-like protein [Lentisphaeria bacterium]
MRRTSPLQKTAFKIAFTSEFLLVGIHCAEQEVDKLSSRAAQRDDSQVCSDDSVEFFLQPDNGFYYQFAVNAAGIAYDGRRPATEGITAAQMLAGLLWDGAWEVMVHCDRDFWSAELRIPFAILDPGSGGPGTWRMNLGRTESRLGYSSWAPVQKGFHDLPRYGELQGLQLDRNSYCLDLSQIQMPEFCIGRNRFSLSIPCKIANGQFQLRQSSRIWQPGLLPERRMVDPLLLSENGQLMVKMELNISHPETLQEFILEICDMNGRLQGILTHLFRPPKPLEVSLPWSCFSGADRILPVHCRLRISPNSVPAALHLKLYRKGWTLPTLEKHILLRNPGASVHILPLRKLPEHGQYQLHWKLEFPGSDETCAGSESFFFLK